MQDLETHLKRQLEHSRDFFWHRLRWRAVRSWLPARAPFTLLDVGAGAGLLGDYLRRDYPQGSYRYIEPIASLAAGLRERFGADNERKPGDTRGASHLALLDVLEHQQDNAAFLASLVAGADKGALIVLTVPALPLLWSRWDTLLGHYRRYTRATLRAAVRGLPVEVLEQSYLFPEMIPPALLRRNRREREGEAEFPDLPRWVNDALFAAGSVSLALRRFVPAGTSLLLVLRKT